MAARNPGEGRGPSVGPGARVVTWLVLAGTLLGTSLLTFRRKPAPSPYGEATGRGTPSTPPSARAETLGFEPHDASARDVTLSLFVLAVGAAAAVGLMFLMLGIFHAERVANAPRLTPEQAANIEPPAPHLQAHPHADLRSLRAREEGLLNAYAWLGADHARARIPIGRAMGLTVGRSLDAGPEPAAASPAGPQR
ncbi:MAG: hypothetical protein M3Y41_17445 [Pseudomonadota bacterium]|nr:hypothetical protein [Pseudomonadota bacterium]